MGLILNGTSQYGQFPAESLFNSSAIFTYAVYFKCNAAATNEQFVFGGYGTGGLDRKSGTIYRGNNSPKYITKVKSSGTNYFNTAAPTADWNVHIHSRNGTGGPAQPVRSLLNGVLFTGTQEENASSDLQRFGVGARRDNTGTYLDFLDGKIGCFAIWNRQLTPTEETFIANKGKMSDISSGLVDYIEFFTAGSPSTVTSLNSRVMTLVGSPSIDTDSPYNQIISVNGDNKLNAGAVNTAVVSGYVVGVNPIISGTVGSLALTSVSQSSTTVTFTISSPSNNSYYPQPDSANTLTLTDGIGGATYSAIMNSIAGYTSVVVASPDNTDTNKLGYWAAVPPVNGDRFMYDTSFWTVAADGSYSGATDGATTVWYHWVIATSKIYIYEATISSGGEIIVTGGLTSAGLANIGLTNAGLTSTGL